MSPSQFHAKKEITPIFTKSNNNNGNGMLPPHLKINRDSHFIKKSSSSPPSSSSSSSSTSSTMINSMATSNKPPQQHRHPVIIYTHSPRVIHTEPKDFMQLVQKLTGLTRSEEKVKNDENNIVSSSQHQPPKQESGTSNMVGDKENDQKKVVMQRNEDNDVSSSVITDEHIYGNNIGENRENQYFIATEAPMFEPPFNPYLTNYLASNSAEFLYSSPPLLPLLNYSDSFFSHNMTAGLPNSNTLEGMNEFGDYGL
ncbi:unnamed protein product [Lathyrus sativus]|nr:unnamed protein product [Lathyrus sativus]